MEKPTILFVDDEVKVLKSMQRLFLQEPYQLLLAESGEDALALIADGEKPEVIVSDQRMPGMSGSEFLAKAKDILPDSIRIILTGHSDINAIMDAINNSGLYRYILKPWNDTDLKLAVAKAVERYYLTYENQHLTRELAGKNRALEKLNDDLEQKVDERTLELRHALLDNQTLNHKLKGKIRELKGRDRVLRHILTIHPLDETLELILDSLIYILRIESAAIYLPRGEENSLKAAAVYIPPTVDDFARSMIKKEFEPGTENYRLAQEVFNSHMASIGQAVDPEDGDKTYSAVSVPVMREKECLGVIHVVKKDGSPLDMSDVTIVGRLSLHTAIAITDSQLQIDIPAWQDTLDDVLSSDLIKG